MHGSQCGFCTPGFVMSMYTLLRNNPQPKEEEIEGAFEGAGSIYTRSFFTCLYNFTVSVYKLFTILLCLEFRVCFVHAGNVCRCTGYRPILEGYKTFAKV